ncbi:MAG: TolC family protein [Flavobacteriales bacterium]
MVKTKQTLLLVLLSLGLVWNLHAQAWTLDSCISRAVQFNIALQIGKNNVELAEINEAASFGNMLPNLNGQMSHGYNWGQRIDPFTNSFATSRIRSNQIGVASSVNLFNGFALRNTYEQTKVSSDITRWNYNKTQNDVSLNVATSFLNVLMAKELVRNAERNLESTTTQAQRIQKLVTGGQLAQNAYTQIESQLAANQASLTSAQNAFKLAKIQLMQWMRLDVREVDAFQIIAPEIPDDPNGSLIISNPDVAVQAALRAFPEIKSAELNVAYSKLGEKIAEGGYYPSLNASVSLGTGYSGAAKVVTGNPDTLSFPIGTVYGSGNLVMSIPQTYYSASDYSTKSLGNQFTDNVNRSLFFTLNIPIFNGFSTKNSVHRARLNSEQAELQLEQSRMTLEQEVLRAHQDAMASFANLQANKASRDAAQKALDWAQSRYENGAIDFSEYFNARILFENAQSLTTRAKFEYVFKISILEFYQGKSISLRHE